MRQLLMIYEELKLQFPNHSSLIIFVKALQKMKILKVEVSTQTLNTAFKRLVEKDDYELESEDDIKKFLRSQILKTRVKKPL